MHTSLSINWTKLVYGTNRESFLREMVDALERVEAAQRPHSNACECEQCEAWDSVKRLLAKLK